MLSQNIRGETISLRLSEAIRTTKAEGEISIISEIKAWTPRDGDLLQDRYPVNLALEMEEAGAQAISVVTENKHFRGDLQILRDVAGGVRLPTLRKDFIKTKEQVLESREAGADAILLISSMLSINTIRELYAYSTILGMDTVIEVHNEEEMEAISGLNPVIIGINNRDISKHETDNGDVSRTEFLAPLIPDDSLLISESSITSPGDVRRVMDAGADAVLVGTALMKAPDIRAKMKELMIP
jgi:indole-3-glycerol phosphate synthase